MAVSSSPCTCGRRHGGTRTVPRSATCSSPTTCGIRSCGARKCRSCTTSAARTPRTAARWISDDVLIPGLPATSDDACYRAMGWLLEIKDQLERKVFDNLAGLLNLEVDLLFFDTASTYFVTEEADEPVARDKNGNAVTSENTDGEDRK